MSKHVGVIPEETKSKLLAAAIDEFYEHGYEKASLRRICSKAEVTTGAVYSAFGSKQELFSEVISPITKIVSAMSAQFATVFTENNYAALEMFIDFYFEHIKLYVIIWNSMNNEIVSEYMAKEHEIFYNQIRDIISKGMPDGVDISMVLDDCTTRWCASAFFDSIMQIVPLGYDIDTAKKYFVSLTEVLKNGMLSIIENKLKGL